VDEHPLHETSLKITHSSVRLPLAPADDGRALGEITALIDTPEEPHGRVLLFHGFGRGPDALDALALAIAQAGIWVMRPHLRSRPAKGGLNDRDLMAAVGFAAAAFEPDAGPLVIVAHSAGGAVGMRAAQRLLAAGVRLEGVVLLDANGNVEQIMQPALDALREAGVPVRTVAAAAGRCNKKAQIARWLGDQDLGFAGVQLTSGMHCDAEDDKADLTCRLLCGGAVNPRNAAVLRALVVGWVRGWIAGQDDADLLPGGRRLQVWQDLDVIQLID